MSYRISQFAVRVPSPVLPCSVLVLLSHALGVPMNLVFTPAEMLAVAISVFVLSQIAGDGESNWLEGVFLLVVYTMLGVLFYHLPAEASG